MTHTIAKSRGFFPEGVDIKTNLFEVVSEIAEIEKANRDGRNVELNEMQEEWFIHTDNDYTYVSAYENLIKDTVEQELAGSIIALLSISKHLNIDIEKHISLEMRYNELRARDKK